MINDNEIQPRYIQRFYSKVKIVAPCWEWIAGKNKDGYGVFSFNGKNMLSHRFAYKLLKGDLDDSLTIDHLCRNTSCVNPEHLDQVTIQKNISRGIRLRGKNHHCGKKTHCPQGHEYSQSNTSIKKNGSRRCRECCRLYAIEKRKELKRNS